MLKKQKLNLKFSIRFDTFYEKTINKSFIYDTKIKYEP